VSGGLSPRRKGAGYERDVVAWLRANGLPHVERRIAGMAADRGDITGWPGVVIECKAHKALCLSAWADQLALEALEAEASVSALFVKRVGRGDVADHYVVMRPDVWLSLMRQAGWVAA
jgi:hypothetical protein